MAVSYVEVEPSQPSQKQAQQGLLAEVWATGSWRLMPVIFIYVMSIAIVLPAKPEILTDFFASHQAGYKVACGSYAVGLAPEVCRNAHSDAVWWGSFSDFASHSIVSFLLAPMVGRWSDRRGRKPFISLFLVVASVPCVLLAAHINAGVSLLYYFPVQAFAGANLFLSLCTAYVADLVSPTNRASAIGLNMGAFALAFLIGPPVGGVTGVVTASYLSMGGVLFALLLLLVVVPESLTEDVKAGAKEKQWREDSRAQLPWNCLRILGRSELFVKLAICTAIIGFVSLGLLELLAQYLQLKLNYDRMDLAVVMTAAGAAGLITQTVVLRLLMSWLGETRILILSSFSRILEQVLLCAAMNRGTVTAAVVVGACAHLSMPAISSLISKNIDAWEQGSAQGALYAAFALAQGLGPLVFAFLFSGFTRSDSTWTYFPGAPFLFGAFLMGICTMVACTINGRAAEKGLHSDVLPEYKRKQTIVQIPEPPGGPPPPQQHINGPLRSKSMDKNGRSWKHAHE